ncbi:MAG TPA: hypothetical protein DCE41_08555, partial [Cytophagales bacterium]|nr:hypothetical protein [Cytophagales bacterium]
MTIGLCFGLSPVVMGENAKPFRRVKVQVPQQAATLPAIFTQLEQQTSYAFAYGQDVLSDEALYTLPADEDNLLVLLEDLLLQADLVIYRRNYNVSVKKAPPNLESPRIVEETVRYTISGYLRETTSGEGLIGATVYDEETQSGVVSNTYGFFSLSLPEGPVALECSFVGAAAQTLQFDLAQDTTLTITLDNAITLEEVVVQGRYPLQEVTQMSSVHLDMEEVTQMPAFLGEVDLFKTMQLMPGVAGGIEGTSGLHVRGGTPDQNLVLLDGAPVYNINHLFGIFTVFNPDAIKNMEMIKGGFPARYGGRLASVMDISMKEGNAREFHGVAALGTISSKITLEGPIIKDKTSFIVSGRRTYADLFIQPIVNIRLNTEDQKFRIGYFFHDLNAKINHRFSDRNQLFLSYYGGKDSFFLQQVTDRPAQPANPAQGLAAQPGYRDEVRLPLYWANRTGTLRWNSMLHPKVFLHAMATYSEYDLNTESYTYTETSYPDTTLSYFSDVDYRSGIQDYSAKVSLEYIPVPNHSFRFGGMVTRHRFIPGVRAVSTDWNPNFTLAEDSVGAWEYAVYAEDELSLGSRISANVGLHYSAFAVQGVTYHSLQPRINARVLLGARTSLKASFNTMTQYLHLLNNVGVALPTDMWVPATSRGAPQQAIQTGLGVAHT